MATAKAIVVGNDGEKRDGRGFSRQELKNAGLGLKQALKLGLPVDSKRKTAHEENVEALKATVKAQKPASKSKRKSKS